MRGRLSGRLHPSAEGRSRRLRRPRCSIFIPTSASTAGRACRRARSRRSSRSTKRRGKWAAFIAKNASLLQYRGQIRAGGTSHGSDRPPVRRQLHHDEHRSRAELGARVVDLADGLRPGVLRDRDDGGVGLALRHRAVRRRGVPRLAAAVRPDDRRRHGDQEDGAGAAPALRPDARAEVGDLDGQLLERRRPVPDLQRAAGRRQGRAGRRLRVGLPAASRGAALRPDAAAGQDSQGRHGAPQGARDHVGRRPSRRSSASGRRHADHHQVLQDDLPRSTC